MNGDETVGLALHLAITLGRHQPLDRGPGRTLDLLIRHGRSLTEGPGLVSGDVDTTDELDVDEHGDCWYR